jgi:diguanylate cyclase (GGDEF)-like protein
VPFPGLPPVVDGLSIRPHRELNSVGAIIPRDARLAPGQRLEELRVFFEQLGAGILVHAPVGNDRVVFITERRGDRTISVEEWQILNLLTEQAEGALKRITLFEETRSLSLTDELTGLANRRHMRLVLDPAFSAARRGVPLTVLLLDLDNFKQVNDREGHLAGDRMLRRVAQCLAKQGRGSDLVVRFGGDEFLVIFPGGTRASADMFAERVTSQLEPAVPFSAGIAEFAAPMQTVEELIAAADRELYASKRARGLGTVVELGGSAVA